MRIGCLLCVAFGLIRAESAPAEPLTPKAAVALALANNSALDFDRSAIAIAQADVTDARLRRNPAIQTLLPVGIKPFEFLLNWPIEDLWQRKKRVLAAQQNLEAIAASLMQNGLNLARDVRLAHTDLWLAEQRSRTLAESAALRDRIAVLTQRRLDSGDASGLDVRIARADAVSAAEMAARAAGEIEVARARLRVLLGLRDDPRPISTVLDPPAPSAAAKQLAETAYASRPDLRAAEIAIEASAYRAKWQRSRIWNLVMPMLSSKEVGSMLSLRAGPGLQAELPLFNRNEGQIARADAEVVQSAKRYKALRDRVEADVREAAARLEQSRESLERLRTQLLPAVQRAIDLTEAGYRNGDLSLLNVLEVTRQRFDAALRELDAQAAMARSAAELDRAIGRTI